MISRPAALDSAQGSYVQWIVLGEHALPVRSDVPAPDTRNTLFLVLVTSLTASATDEVGTSTMASTPLVSNHSRARLEPMSGLFWWSAAITSIVMPATLPPKSSTAIRAASSEPLPARSAYGPDMSVITPMTSLSPPPPPPPVVAPPEPPDAALPPPAALSASLQAAHSAAAHRVTIIERFARCLSIAAPRVFISRWLGSARRPGRGARLQGTCAVGPCCPPDRHWGPCRRPG